MGVFLGSNEVKAAAIMRTPKLKVPSSNALDEVASVPLRRLTLTSAGWTFSSTIPGSAWSGRLKRWPHMNAKGL
jgi:hypothetical protein